MLSHFHWPERRFFSSRLTGLLLKICPPAASLEDFAGTNPNFGGQKSNNPVEPKYSPLNIRGHSTGCGTETERNKQTFFPSTIQYIPQLSPNVSLNLSTSGGLRSVWEGGQPVGILPSLGS